jgi:D-arabinose 5-phosphate isomerase GutQ
MEISPDPLLQAGKSALQQESKAILALQDQLDESLTQAVLMILNCKGHVVVSGAGTSSSVARRMAHLLNCVGAPAFFLGVDESAHGSAATLTPQDVLIAISKGGETDELNSLVRFAHQQGAGVIALTGKHQSSMAAMSDVVVCFVTPLEADGYGVIALGSSLAAGAMGDAICAAILSVRGFSPDFFLKVHPGGAVGKQLSAKGG